jgi:translation initiation factor 2 beta subunit (eIF-2beta)/eIF-5
LATTELLERAFTQASKLPEKEQNAEWLMVIMVSRFY